MTKQLSQIKEKYHHLKSKLENPEILKNPKTFAELSREFHQLEKIFKLSSLCDQLKSQIQQNKSLLKTEKDPELLSLAKEERLELLGQLKTEEEKLKTLLLPEDPYDKKNVVLEIRAGTGGDEASLFVQDLFSAYRAYSLAQSWKVEILSASDGKLGGFKELIATLSGNKVYSFLKHESGVHRVQRVPETESQGRIHTSTVTVVVLPEADPIQLKLNPLDLRIDVQRSSGSGGQHVNTTDSAVRVVHLPTKITVYCQQEKSQRANKEKALKILYARLLDFQTEKQKQEESQKRKNQMGTGERSQRIRTYNFPQSRITDHRISYTAKNLPQLMQGDFSNLFSALQTYYRPMLDGSFS